MTKRMNLIAGLFVMTLMMTAVAPKTAHAVYTKEGTLTIYNHNCSKWKGFKLYKRVTVHVFNNKAGCTETTVTLGHKQSQTIKLTPFYFHKGEKKDCKYKHEANGTVAGKKDIYGGAHSSVTCKKDWADVCQCTKD